MPIKHSPIALSINCYIFVDSSEKGTFFYRSLLDFDLDIRFATDIQMKCGSFLCQV